MPFITDLANPKFLFFITIFLLLKPLKLLFSLIILFILVLSDRFFDHQKK